MRRSSFRFLLAIIVILLTAAPLCEGQTKGRSRGKNPEKSLFGKSRKVKEKKVREPRSVTKAKRKQEKNEARLKKDYNNYVEDSRERAYKIQTPEVQARMKQNGRDIKSREKARKKNSSRATREGRRKYGK